MGFEFVLSPYKFPLPLAIRERSIGNGYGRDIEKDVQNYGKNFPVNKAWGLAFARMGDVLP
jgi:hypothetical protein